MVTTIPHILHAVQTDATTFHVFDPDSVDGRDDYARECTIGHLLKPMLELATGYLSKNIIS
jgi:hypothetical protein